MNILNTFRERIANQSRSTAAPVSAMAASASPQVNNTAERPFFTGQSNLPSRETFSEIFRRCGNPDVVTPEERKALKKIQRKIDAINGELKQLSYEGIRAAVKDARRRLAKGKGQESDAALTGERGAQILIESRKSLKRQIHPQIESAHKLLVPIAERVQLLARKVLPEFEAESIRLGLAPHQVPVVLNIGRACWTPAAEAVRTIHAPKHFLKLIGIKL